MCLLFLAQVDVSTFIEQSHLNRKCRKSIYGFAIFPSRLDHVIEFETSFKSLNASFFLLLYNGREKEEAERERERWKKIGSWLQQFYVINKQMKI